MTTMTTAEHGSLLERFALWIGITDDQPWQPRSALGHSKLDNGRDQGQRRVIVTARSVSPKRRCDTAALRGRYRAELDAGASTLEIDLSTIDHVDAELISCLVELARAVRSCNTGLLIRPSVAVERWLEKCRLDCHLQPTRP